MHLVRFSLSDIKMFYDSENNAKNSQQCIMWTMLIDKIASCSLILVGCLLETLQIGNNASDWTEI